MSLFSKNPVLAETFSASIRAVSEKEELSAESIRAGIESGTMVLLGNPSHSGGGPLLVGQPSRVKVNANIGTSPLKNSLTDEIEKLRAALEAGADTVMDLSIAGDLSSIRQTMLENCPRPLGTVPLYAVAQRYLDADLDPADIPSDEIFEEIKTQAEQGVDFMTVHCGLTARAASWALEDSGRRMGIVSRGGSILARWMQVNKAENPLLSGFSRILEIARKHNVTLSLGDGLRPGAGSDAGDCAQWDEVIMLGRLVKEARAHGVQCMVEGPGHVRMHEVEAQIRGVKTACHGAPLYVLGPLVIDSSPGYDHVAGAIGGALAVRAGADYLCYLTPAEHLTLPDIKDVKDGVIASKIAAQAGEVALNRPTAVRKEDAISLARKNLDWQAMRDHALDPHIICQKRAEHASEEVCAMCGKFCAVKLLRRKD